jgi:hypothetical protein
MIKSFTESGGTVLSTNWEEVGKGPVKGSPPQVRIPTRCASFSLPPLIAPPRHRGSTVSDDSTVSLDQGLEMKHWD